MVTIRLVLPTEVPQLQHLNHEVFVDNQKYDDDLIQGWPTSTQGEEYFTALVNDPKNVCFVAQNDQGQLVGYIAGSPKTIDYRKSRYFEVENMGVSPEYRSQGIGQQLITACTKWAQEKGYQRLFVTAYSANQSAISFYQKCGFKDVDISLEMKIG